MNRTVQRYNGIERDPEGAYVHYEDYDALRTLARALAREVLTYKHAVDAIYNHNMAAQTAVRQHYGHAHNITVIEQAYAVLKEGK